MGKSSETFSKREKEKKRLQKRKDKDEKKEERKSGKDGKSFEDMIAYVDEYGQFSSTPPDLTKKRVVKESDIELESKNKGGAGVPVARVGIVKFFDKDKGYGFIKDSATQDEFFFHFRAANFPIAQSDKVTFDTERGPKGPNAVRIIKV